MVAEVEKVRGSVSCEGWRRHGRVPVRLLGEIVRVMV